jgi:hypothetical protein
MLLTSGRIAFMNIARIIKILAVSLASFTIPTERFRFPSLRMRERVQRRLP